MNKFDEKEEEEEGGVGVGAGGEEGEEGEEEIEFKKFAELFTPEKMHKLRNMSLFKMFRSFVMDLLNIKQLQLLQFIKTNIDKLDRIQIDNELLQRNYHSLQRLRLDNLKQKFDEYFFDEDEDEDDNVEKEPNVKNLFCLYEVWYVYLKDGNLVLFFELIQEETMDYTFLNIFSKFRTFYNSLHGISFEPSLSGGGKSGGGKSGGGKKKQLVGGAGGPINLRLLGLSFLLLLIIIPFGNSPGSQLEILETHLIVNPGVKVLSIILDSRQKDKELLLRRIFNSNKINDLQVEYFLMICMKFLKGVSFLATNVPGGNAFSPMIKKTKFNINLIFNIIKFSQTVSNYLSISSKSISSIHSLLYFPTQGIYTDAGINIQKFTKEQLKDLELLGQLSLDDYMLIPTTSFPSLLHSMLEDDKYDWLSGGGRKKNSTRRKRNKCCIKSTKYKYKIKKRKFKKKK